MEKLILTHCILLLLVVVVLLGLLLWNTEKRSGKVGSFKDNLLLFCASLIGFIMLHMNWLLLPWSVEQQGILFALAAIVVLAISCSVPAIYLLKNLFESRPEQPVLGNSVNKK